MKKFTTLSLVAMFAVACATPMMSAETPKTRTRTVRAQVNTSASWQWTARVFCSSPTAHAFAAAVSGSTNADTPVMSATRDYYPRHLVFRRELVDFTLAPQGLRWQAFTEPAPAFNAFNDALGTYVYNKGIVSAPNGEILVWVAPDASLPCE